MGFCNLWKQYPLTTPLSSVVFEQRGSTETPENSCHPQQLDVSSIYVPLSCTARFPLKKNKRKKALTHEFFPQKATPGSVSQRMSHPRPHQHPASSTAERRKGKNVSSREFPKKRWTCLGTEVTDATAASTRCVEFRRRAGRGCGDTVLSTAEEEMQPVLPLTPSWWDRPSSPNNKHEQADFLP